jgi:hypothetical protein
MFDFCIQQQPHHQRQQFQAGLDRPAWLQMAILLGITLPDFHKKTLQKVLTVTIVWCT